MHDYQPAADANFAVNIQPVAYPRGAMEGSGPPTFQKVGPQDSHKNVIKLMGGGVGQICPEEVSEIRESKQRLVFQGFAARFWFLRNA